MHESLEASLIQSLKFIEDASCLSIEKVATVGEVRSDVDNPEKIFVRKAETSSIKSNVCFKVSTSTSQMSEVRIKIFCVSYSN